MMWTSSIDAYASQVMIAELGPDMTRFSSDRHAASWAAICPATTSPPASAAPAGCARATRTCAPH